MTSPLIDLLTQFPKARVTIVSGPTRKKPRYGDFKVTKAGRFIRKQRTYQGMGCVRNGRPIYEWVHERHWDEADQMLAARRTEP